MLPRRTKGSWLFLAVCGGFTAIGSDAPISRANGASQTAGRVSGLSPKRAPAPSQATGSGTGEYSVGTGDGSANVHSRIPQLLNLSDLRAILQHFYPEEARSQGREGMVVLDIHIDTEGHVASVDVVRSGGSDFDEAARKAVNLLRFTPAFLGSHRVAVKMRQAIQFKLEL